MSKTPITEASLGIPAAVISHTFLRLRGTQKADLTVLHAGTGCARVTLNWGGILWGFRNAQAAQAVLEAVAAARATLTSLPAEVPPAPHEDYDQPAIAIDWTARTSYAVMPRTALSPDRRRTLRWTEVYLAPLTLQILDRAAFHSTLEVLQLAHNVAVAVCLDGPLFAADPTADDYRSPQQ
jgi:hypothetical protein